MTTTDTSESRQAREQIAQNLDQECQELQALRQSLAPCLRALVLMARVHGQPGEYHGMANAAAQVLGGMGVAVALGQSLSVRVAAQARSDQ